jgi:hypothetical protein
MPRLLREIIEGSLAAHDDMDVVAHVATMATLDRTIDSQDVDVVVLHIREEGELVTYDAMLFAHPRVQLLAVAGDARSAMWYALRPRIEPLAAVSPQGLVDAIRAAVPVVVP